MRPMKIAGLVLLALSLALGASGTAAGAGQNALNGRYRATVSDADLVAAGVAARYIRLNHGTYVFTLRDGRFRFTQSVDSKVVFRFPLPSYPSAPYSIKGDWVRFVFRVPGAPCCGAPPPLTFRWKLAGSQLRFTLVAGQDPLKIGPVAFTAHPWKKIS